MTFPEAKFIVLIREPYTWLPSVVGHLLSRQIPPEVRAFLDWWFKPDQYLHTPDDVALKKRGLYSIDAFLAAWNRHVDACLDSIPAERRLILRTHELDQSHQRFADFLKIPVDSVDAAGGYLNRSTFTESFDALVDPAHVEGVVQERCGENMSQVFPEVEDRQDAEQLWPA